jgi:hypothetical protein
LRLTSPTCGSADLLLRAVGALGHDALVRGAFQAAFRGVDAFLNSYRLNFLVVTSEVKSGFETQLNEFGSLPCAPSTSREFLPSEGVGAMVGDWCCAVP